MSRVRSGKALERPCERAQQHDVALDRDQPADAEEPRRRHGRGRLAVARRDPVVDDLEALLVEALRVGQVPREPARDRDLDVREARDGAVAEREAPALTELVEAVLGREPHRHPGHRAGDLAVGVGVDEVRVEDRRPRAGEVAGDLRERHRVDVGGEADRVDRHPARLELPGEVPGARLVLVQHQQPDVPAAVAQVGQQREQVRLRAGDPGHLLHVEDERRLHAAEPSKCS